MNKKLADLLADVFGLRPLDITSELDKSEVDSWDSLKQMDLVMSLEREYGITLDILDIVRITSVAAIISVLNEKGVTLAD
jgi:acyl carrier protein